MIAIMVDSRLPVVVPIAVFIERIIRAWALDGPGGTINRFVVKKYLYVAFILIVPTFARNSPR